MISLPPLDEGHHPDVIKTISDEEDGTMRIFYDTEFLEDGKTIDLISIGMVRDDGAEYYAIANCPRLIGSWLARIGEHEWLLANVVPSLPLRVEPVPTQGGGIWNYVTWNKDHPDYVHVKEREVIAAEVRDFILAKPDPELWADYCAYDHVALCQLYGRMIDLPQGLPYFTHDLRHALGPMTDPPPMPGAREHNALDDAREVRWRLQWLAGEVAAP